MLWAPQKGILRCEHNVTGPPSAQVLPGTVITSGAAAATKGAWGELFAATLFDAYFMVIHFAGISSPGVSTRACVDIGIGAATEEVLIADLLGGGAGSTGASANVSGPKLWAFPIYIPAGSRITARYASERLSFSTRIAMWLYGGHGYPPFRVGTKVTTYGIGTVPGGTAITPGVSAEGAWTQIAAASSDDHFAFAPSFQTSGTTVGNKSLTTDIGIGAATEEELASSYWWQTDSSETLGGPQPAMPTWADVPAGTRLAMRAGCNGALAGPYEVALHAVS